MSKWSGLGDSTELSWMGLSHIQFRDFNPVAVRVMVQKILATVHSSKVCQIVSCGAPHASQLGILSTCLLCNMCLASKYPYNTLHQNTLTFGGTPNFHSNFQVLIPEGPAWSASLCCCRILNSRRLANFTEYRPCLSGSHAKQSSEIFLKRILRLASASTGRKIWRTRSTFHCPLVVNKSET
jgi:hypothetical protein